MKIFDINCMLGTWPLFALRFNDANSLVQEMDNYHIESCLAFHSMSLWNPEQGNKEIHEIASAYLGRIRPCFVLDPALGTYSMQDKQRMLDELSVLKPAAVKLYPNPGIYELDSFYCGELLEILNELGMPVLFDSDQMPPYDKLPGLSKNYPQIKFILLRRPFNESRYIMPLIKKTNNIYFDISIMVDTGLIEEITQKFGCEKLLFGSGMPFYLPSGPLGLVMYLRIKDKDKEMIFYDNWHRIGDSPIWK